jgi:hypothetical protein
MQNLKYTIQGTVGLLGLAVFTIYLAFGLILPLMNEVREIAAMADGAPDNVRLLFGKLATATFVFDAVLLVAIAACGISAVFVLHSHRAVRRQIQANLLKISEQLIGLK